jgi:hypothetical protein
MVEANKCANAGEVKCFRVVGSAGCMGCHGHGLGCLLQEHDLDVLLGSASGPEALAGVSAGMLTWLLIAPQLLEPKVASALEVEEAQ